MKYQFAKQNARMMILDMDGKMVYTPPDFIRGHIRSRQEMIDLMGEMETSENYIDEVMIFESFILDRARFTR